MQNGQMKLMLNLLQNRYYDIHYFFNTLIKKGFFPELLTDPQYLTKLKIL